MRRLPRYLGVVMLLAAGAVAALGYDAMRHDAGRLDDTGRGAMLWWGAQTEIDMLKFELRLADLRLVRTEAAADAARQSFNALWSRVTMIGTGAIGARLREYDEGPGAVRDLAALLREIDPVIAELRPDDPARVAEMLRRLEALHRPLRLYTLRVMQADAEISAELRDRISWSARVIVSISGLALLAAFMSLFFLMRDNRSQRAMARMSQRAAEAAELASRAQSRFLSMMSHELRNPLNGVLGPLALLGQSDMGSRQRRLIEQASQSGNAMSQMVAGLLDYAEIQDGGLAARAAPTRVTALAEMIRTHVRGSTGADLRVEVAEDTPGVVQGDPDRLSQIFVHLAEYLLESCDPAALSLRLAYRAGALVGVLRLADGAGLERKLDLLRELDAGDPEQVQSDALRPLIARGLLSALGGALAIEAEAEGGRRIVVSVPARELALKRVRVFLDTRSKALAAIYRAALRSDDVIFEEAAGPGAVDLVLVDAARAEEEAVMGELRARHPKALFVALGQPGHPAAFDEVVEEPNDFEGLRARIMDRLAS
ncbi:sensor histidine kinase [Amaricoccus solimangrovi]|uniref:histidine kinase n=1 Tax=Amaricoccus solimangrovi TaxID=2589815 RepID=A0A501WUQ0_9RHOB|nr:HAMP domain-containing sensor histidine kinase [Amaricoccus solimangrovi]TPE53009.1 hypothetical protein FJM51_02995 [Amaricoccus solimangrovi]